MKWKIISEGNIFRGVKSFMRYNLHEKIIKKLLKLFSQLKQQELLIHAFQKIVDPKLERKISIYMRRRLLCVTSNWNLIQKFLSLIFDLHVERRHQKSQNSFKLKFYSFKFFSVEITFKTKGTCLSCQLKFFEINLNKFLSHDNLSGILFMASISIFL